MIEIKEIKELYLNIRIIINSLEKVNSLIINKNIRKVLSYFKNFMLEVKKEIEKEATEYNIKL